MSRSVVGSSGSGLKSVLVHGMHGLGDNLHQRGVVRHLMESSHVWLETPWPCVYHDLVGDRLTLISKGSSLRTQAKNAQREADKFSRSRPPRSSSELRIWYPPALVRQVGSVYGAMCSAAKVPVTDFTLPIPPEWDQRAQALLDKWQPDKPLLIYRPLIDRPEWSGCAARNPDHAAYAALVRSIRKDFFLVSVADLVPGKEWMVGEDVHPDVACHAGELEFETLAALVARAALVFSSPGFAVVLAQSVGTPAVCVFGGYEDGGSFIEGARQAPYLPIEPIRPCNCFAHNHDCQKQIDMPKALERLSAFAIDPARNSVHRIGGARVQLGESTPPAVVTSYALPQVTAADIGVRPLKPDNLPKRFLGPGELEAIVALVSSVKPRGVLEIGVNTGRTAKVILDHVPSIERYQGIDVPPGYVFAKAVQRNEVPKQPGFLAAKDSRFRLILSARGSFDMNEEDLAKCDAVFIDGDHGRAAVEHDTRLARKLVRPGGIIIWHDYHHMGTVDVREVLHEAVQQGAQIQHVAGTWVAFERIP